MAKRKMARIIPKQTGGKKCISPHHITAFMSHLDRPKDVSEIRKERLKPVPAPMLEMVF